MVELRAEQLNVKQTPVRGDAVKQVCNYMRNVRELLGIKGSNVFKLNLVLLGQTEFANLAP